MAPKLLLLFLKTNLSQNGRNQREKSKKKRWVVTTSGPTEEDAMTEQPNTIQRNLTIWVALAALFVALVVVYVPDQRTDTHAFTLSSAQTEFPIQGTVQCDDHFVSTLCSFDVTPGNRADCQIWMAYATADWIKVRAPYVGPVFDFYVQGNEGPGAVEFEIAPNCESYDNNGQLVYRDCGEPRMASINVKAVRAADIPDQTVFFTQMGLSTPPDMLGMSRSDAGLIVRWDTPVFGTYDEHLVLWRGVGDEPMEPVLSMTSDMARLGEWVDMDVSPHHVYTYHLTFAAGSNPFFYSIPSNETVSLLPEY